MVPTAHPGTLVRFMFSFAMKVCMCVCMCAKETKERGGRARKTGETGEVKFNERKGVRVGVTEI